MDMTDFTKYENKEWFKELKISRSEYFKVDNIIESAKTKYEKSNHVYEWVTGSGLAILFSLNMGNVLNNQNNWVFGVAYLAYFISLLAVVIGIWLYRLQNQRQDIAMTWLYHEKDKQEKESSLNFKKSKNKD